MTIRRLLIRSVGVGLLNFLNIIQDISSNIVRSQIHVTLYLTYFLNKENYDTCFVTISFYRPCSVIRNLIIQYYGGSNGYVRTSTAKKLTKSMNTKLKFSCLKSTIETLEKSVKYV